MYKTIKADSDTYITNKVIKGTRKLKSNVGDAATLDLFKLYGASSSGSYLNTELSRLLIHFDLEPIKKLIEQNKLDINDPSFWCKLQLKDVYGGQPTPSKFEISVFPLSSSFEEGLGRDVSFYSDEDICNWTTSSYGTLWNIPGCESACSSTSLGDYITSSISIPSTESTQYFKTGNEDLSVDVTKIISATLSGELPDSGFRISFKDVLENDTKTYFVKRFASRTAYDDSKHPQLIFGFDDSINDDTQNLEFDSQCNLILYNYSGGKLSNIVSGSTLTHVTGSSCLLLKLITPISGGYYDLIYTGSQFSYGENESLFVTGTYKANINILSSDPILSSKLMVSSSIEFTPVWTSLDGTNSYFSGSKLYVASPQRSSSKNLKNYIIAVLGVNDSYEQEDEPILKVNIFDQTSPLIKVTKIPVELPGIVVKNVYYQIRDVLTNEPIIPFDLQKKSTKVSSDSNGMFFSLNCGSLSKGKTYVIDILIDQGLNKLKFFNVSPQFRIQNDSDQT